MGAMTPAHDPALVEELGPIVEGIIDDKGRLCTEETVRAILARLAELGRLVPEGHALVVADECRVGVNVANPTSLGGIIFRVDPDLPDDIIEFRNGAYGPRYRIRWKP